MENLSPHVAWQEVKKIQRFLDILNQTEEVLKVLAEYDSIKSKLLSEIPTLEKQVTQSKEQIGLAEKLRDDAKAAYEKTKAEILNARKEAEKQAEEAKSRASQQLESMKNQARESIESSQRDLVKLQLEITNLQDEKKELEQSIEQLKKQASDQINSLVGAFKTLGK